MPADARLIDQIELITTNLEGSAVFPPDWQEVGVDYLYREHALLARSADVDAVVAALGAYLATLVGPDEYAAAEAARERPLIEPRPVIAGLALIDYSAHPAVGLDGALVPDVLDALNTVPAVAGRMREDNIFFVATHPCPAHEPEEVPAGTTRPFPDQDTDYGCGGQGQGQGCGCGSGRSGSGRCDGRNVFVTVADMGLLPDVAGHDWLDGVTGDDEDPYMIVDGVQLIRPYAGHGTFVAGCVRVTAPRAEVHVERDVEPAAASSGATYESEVTLKLDNALAGTPDIVVFEFTTSTRENLAPLGFDVLYENRIRPLKGLAFVAPAGNEGEHDAQWPAAYPWVVSVGALSGNWRTRANFSNFGGWVDVYAPGEDIVNAFPVGDYRCTESPNQGVMRHFDGMATWSGTSFSTPLVAGLIASRMSCTGENGRQAADALLAFARSQAVAGVGAVLFPGQALGGV